jgi:hypothetical protein
MTDNEFMNHAETLLQRLEALCDQFNDQDDLDIDNQRVGGMVTLSFPNKSQLIVNLLFLLLPARDILFQLFGFLEQGAAGAETGLAIGCG